MPKPLEPASLVVAADRDLADGEPFAQSPVFASVYRLAGDPGAGPPGYGRTDNPGWRALEGLLAGLEGGETVVFPSGMAASVAALMPFVSPGDVLVMPSDGYYATRSFAADVLRRFDVEVRLVPTTAMAELDGTGIDHLWLETPSNPGLDCCDIETLSTRAHAAGAKVVVDNTTATPLAQTPLTLGADLVVSADTKALNGHSDALYGHVAARDPADAQNVRRWRELTGSIPGPMATFLVQRGLATLDVRLERMCANALDVARFLAGHARVECVRYPGLEDDPAHALARRQMRRFGFLVGVTFEDVEAARALLERTRLVKEATSFGGVHTTAEQRARWGGDDVPPRFVRMSMGVEPIADLLADLKEALR